MLPPFGIQYHAKIDTTKLDETMTSLGANAMKVITAFNLVLGLQYNAAPYSQSRYYFHLSITNPPLHIRQANELINHPVIFNILLRAFKNNTSRDAKKFATAIAYSMSSFFDPGNRLNLARTQIILDALLPLAQLENPYLAIRAAEAITQNYQAFFDDQSAGSQPHIHRTLQIVTAICDSGIRVTDTGEAIRYLHSRLGNTKMTGQMVEILANARSPKTMVRIIRMLCDYNLASRENLAKAAKIENGLVETFGLDKPQQRSQSSPAILTLYFFLINLYSNGKDINSYLSGDYNSLYYPTSLQPTYPHHMVAKTAQQTAKAEKLPPLPFTQSHFDMFINLSRRLMSCYHEVKKDLTNTGKIKTLHETQREIELVIKYLTFSVPFADVIDLNRFVALLKEHNITNNASPNIYTTYTQLIPAQQAAMFDILRYLHKRSIELKLPILYSFTAFITIIALPENCALMPQTEDSGTTTSERYVYKLGQEFDPTSMFGPLTVRNNRYSVVALMLLQSGLFTMLGKDRDLKKVFSTLCTEGQPQVGNAMKIFFDYLAPKLQEGNIPQLLAACRAELEILSLAQSPSILANHANIDKRLSPALVALYSELGNKMISYIQDLGHILSVHRITAASEQATNTIRHILVIMFFTMPALLTAIAKKDEKKAAPVLSSYASSVASHTSYASSNADSLADKKAAPGSHVGSTYSHASTQPGALATSVARGEAWTSHSPITSRSGYSRLL